LAGSKHVNSIVSAVYDLGLVIILEICYM
jgi:hypothetical protein